jgi:hypothetical protein
MTALGLASGIAVSFVYVLEPIWRELSVGVVFGLVIAGYLLYLRLADPLRAAIYAALTVGAWFVAERTAVEVFGQLPGKDVFFSFKGLATGLVGGLVGAFLLALAGALLFPFYRRPGLGLATLATGGAAGMLIALIDITDSGLVLFPPWQAAIAYCLARGLPPSPAPP